MKAADQKKLASALKKAGYKEVEVSGTDTGPVCVTCIPGNLLANDEFANFVALGVLEAEGLAAEEVQLFPQAGADDWLYLRNVEPAASGDEPAAAPENDGPPPAGIPAEANEE